MPVFTVVLKDILARNEDIGLGDYPVPAGVDTDVFRANLNQKIIDHYWNREIGHETVSLFTFALGRKMREIMPYYNQLYASELLNIEPLLTLQMKQTNEQETDGNSTGSQANSGDSSNTSRSIASSFPQQMLNQNAGGNYADSAQDTTGTAKNSGTVDETRTSTDKTSGTSSQEGFSGSQAALLQAYRQTFLNIDMAVIAQLEDCFMQVWDSADSYSGR